MTTNWLKQILLFVLLVLLQVWVFNQIHLFGIATPLFYVYFILKMPTSINRNLVIFLSALIGFCIDLFNYTLGLNMLAATVAGFMRHYALNLFSPREMIESYIPSIKVFGFGPFMRYASFIILIHHIVLFTVEYLSLYDPLMILIRIGANFVLTLILIFAAEGFSFQIAKK